jgi:hypothetical protein
MNERVVSNRHTNLHSHDNAKDGHSVIQPQHISESFHVASAFQLRRLVYNTLVTISALLEPQILRKAEFNGSSLAQGRI